MHAGRPDIAPHPLPEPTREDGAPPAAAVVASRERFRLPRAVEADEEIFVFGDIHGRSDLLEALIAYAGREPRGRPHRRLVFLGDLIDRGPDSLGAIQLAVAARDRLEADETIALMGNHEAMMRMALEPATPHAAALDALQAWASNGGDRTIAEFLRFGQPPRTLDDLLAACRASAPPWLLAWLESLKPHWRSNRVLFVHGGVNPDADLEAFLAAPWNAPLAGMDEDWHWAWVRWPFIFHDPNRCGWGGYLIVHGHTPRDGRDDPSHAGQIECFRLNLDAGSGVTGEAKMAILRRDQADVVTARGPTDEELGG